MSATQLAQFVVWNLIRRDISEVVLSPGSRNAPLGFALRAAERAGLIRLHVRIDERSAGFLALGLAKAHGKPVAVCATSGTAIANLHPAIVEADMSRTPLVVLSANRPLGTFGTGANQTIDQVGIFGSATRSAVHLADDEPHTWDGLCAEALESLYSSDIGAGPVQLDLGFSMPLVPPPGREVDWVSDLTRERMAAADPDGAARRVRTERISVAAATLIVVAETTGQLAASAITSASALGFPVHVEAGSSLALATGECLQAGTFLIQSTQLMQRAAPTQVVVVGRPTLNRSIATLVNNPAITVNFVHDHAGFPRPFGATSAPVVTGLVEFDGTADPGFAAAWGTADDAAREYICAQREFDAPRAAATVADSRPDLIVAASSNPIRDLDERAPRGQQPVIVNRGAAGIDGMISTAIGSALALGTRQPGARTVALLGDLAFLHDHTGLIIGPQEPRPDVTIVVLNNDGGAIFATLEQGQPQYADDFERLFGTSHGVDLRLLCEATATPYRRAGTEADLAAALAHPPGGINVVEVRFDRTNERSRRDAFRARVMQAIDAAIEP